MRWFRRKRKKPIIVGHPYQNLKFHHKRKKPVPLDAINPHILCPGKSGVGKSELALALWKRDVDDAKATVMVDTHEDLTRRAIRYLMYKGIDPKNVLISDPAYKPEELGVV